MPQHYTVTAFWDADAGVWVASRGDHETWYSPITDCNITVHGNGARPPLNWQC